MQSQQPEPGKIHKLPIQVYYNIPSSTHTFITTLDTAQPVFIHPAIANGQQSTRSRSASVSSRRGVGSSGRKRRKLDGHGRSYADMQGSDSPDEREEGDDSEDEDGEKWLVSGSTSLKAVMEAVCKAR
ncbi:hypothetical protein QFC20_005679 [Naganishia adeliensis]|uniref:Uncharacterized protein n=1 Tax=Naganishia adeliensis TaxID=92952 RepID=A0ACC2VK49_9TREE|nr:hypothetical protein QFC20_005679 [Naganishia adeliensis]